jgi:curved DNA-binding protein CbpA
VATRVRDWADVDFYKMLGVRPDASGDEIARAFRGVAKQMHPDANDDPQAAERFKNVSNAYAVLSNRRTRRDYDLVRAGSTVEVRSAATAVPVRQVRPSPNRNQRVRPWSRRKAWTAVIAGGVVAILGVAAGMLTVMLHDHDAQIRAHDIPVTAQRVGNGDISFTTRNGVEIETKEPEQHGDPSALGPTANVRYDPNDPHHVIVDANTLGRDITFAIVALKMLIGGLVFFVIGVRRVRKLKLVR